MSVEITDDQDVPIDRKRLCQRLSAALKKAGCSRSELSILLTSDARMSELNGAYRGVPAPTDVLSFPQDAFENDPVGRILGDIVISVATALRQAQKAGISLDQEVENLAVHGLLHLLGHDHETQGWARWRKALKEIHPDG